MVKISRIPAAPHRPDPRILARRPAHRRLAGPRHGPAQLLRHLDRHRSGARAAGGHRPGPGEAGPPAAGAAGAPDARPPAARSGAALPRPHGPHRPRHPVLDPAGGAGGGAAGQPRPRAPLPTGGGAGLGRVDPGRRGRRWSRSRCATGAPGWSPTGIGDTAAICSPRAIGPCSSPATPPTPMSSTRIGERVKVDLAILPIGAYDPWIANHASPEQAWRMFKELGAEYLLPVHHSTFRLSREPVEEPMERLLAAAGSRGGGWWSSEIGATWSLPTRWSWGARSRCPSVSRAVRRDSTSTQPSVAADSALACHVPRLWPGRQPAV